MVDMVTSRCGSCLGWDRNTHSKALCKEQYAMFCLFSCIQTTHVLQSNRRWQLGESLLPLTDCSRCLGHQPQKAHFSLYPEWLVFRSNKCMCHVTEKPSQCNSMTFKQILKGLYMNFKGVWITSATDCMKNAVGVTTFTCFHDVYIEVLRCHSVVS